MRYVGLALNKIEAEKTEESPSGNVSVNSNFNLGKIKKEEIGSDPKKPVFSFEFDYSLKYEKFATIAFKGKIYVEIEDRGLIKELEKSDKTPENNELRKFVLEVVLARTHVDTLHLEEKLGLPFHIQSPKVSFEKN